MGWFTSLIDRVKQVIYKVVDAIERFVDEVKNDPILESAAVTTAPVTTTETSDQEEPKILKTVKKVATTVIEIVMGAVLVAEIATIIYGSIVGAGAVAALALV
mgnify:CR=1 FL=1